MIKSVTGAIVVAWAGISLCVAGDAVRRAELPGERSAEQILNGEYWWPDSPEADTSVVDNLHFVPDAFGKAPPPGVHPRILISPDELPALRERIKNTATGRYYYHQLTINQENSIRKEGTFSHRWFQALAAGDEQRALDIMSGRIKAPMESYIRRYHPPAFVLMSEAFDAVVREDEAMGKEVAAAITTLSKIYMNRLEAMDRGAETGEIDSRFDWDDHNVNRLGFFQMNERRTQLNSDVFRSGRREAIDNEPWLALMYDFAHPFMTGEQRAVVRTTINKYHYGKTTMGSHMPHHFRNWNWIPIGSGGLLLTALATEGEEGNDPRVIEHAAEILTDYVKYGWSAMGSSTEAIGYTAFGLGSGVPALVALARRGHNVWGWKRWRGQVDWYAHATQPDALNKPTDQRFISHGDAGTGSPNGMLAFKRFYPDDPQVDFVAQVAGLSVTDKADENGEYKIPGRGFYDASPVVGLLLLGPDVGDTDHQEGKALGYPNTFFDPERNSLITRSKWGPDQVQLQFEARNDSTSPSHQHADRGAFTLSGAGRIWAGERFRSPESRHHSLVIIDGKGQGRFTPPSDWLGLVDNEHVTIGAVDTAYSYAWAWPRYLAGFTNPDDPRLKFMRWRRFNEGAEKFLAENPDYDWQAAIDRHPTVEAFYNGFEKGDPRIWDEYGRPQRLAHNPVEKAFRTAMMVRGKFPYVVIVDDIKKDDHERLYEWLMMVTPGTGLFAINTDRILLYDQEHPDARAPRRLGKGVPMCLVQVLERTIPQDVFTNPQIRMEEYELKDADDWPRGRSFGLDKRLVIPSRTVEPNFKVLLYPHYKGTELPKINWNENRDQVTVSFPDQIDVITFKPDGVGRTKVSVTRDGTELGGL